MKKSALWLLFVLGWAMLASADEAQQTEQELENLRKEIKALRDEIESTTEARDSQRAAIVVAEKDIAKIHKQLSELRAAQLDTNAELTALQGRVEAKRRDVAATSKQLVGQLRSAYRSGQQGGLKLTLNSEDPVALARVTTYYGFLTRYRHKQLQDIRQQLSELYRLDRQVKTVLQQQQALEADAQQTLLNLEKAVQRRRLAVTELDQRLESQDSQVSTLLAQEKALQKLLEELKDLLSEYPVQTEQAFAGLKGQLQWPLAGRLLHDYGQPRAPKISWNGVVIAAQAGTRVRSVARGRVTYSDWLPGLGQLVIVDHGGGYMSLYGYNQMLTRAVGDWVAPGDSVALVGDSGGRSQSSLYFEIRSSGKPLNPHPWFKTSIPQAR